LNASVDIPSSTILHHDEQSLFQELLDDPQQPICADPDSSLDVNDDLFPHHTEISSSFVLDDTEIISASRDCLTIALPSSAGEGPCNNSFSSSDQLQNDITSLEANLDDFYFVDDDTSSTSSQCSDGNIYQDYVEGTNVKDLLLMLSDELIPLQYKSQIDKLHPVEEELMIIMRQYNLPIRLYDSLLHWAHRASESNYHFSCPTYQTVLGRMKKKYLLDAGSSPLCSMVELPGESFPPMHVYRFSLLHEVKKLLHKNELLDGALWTFQPEHSPDTKERVYHQLNSGDWWELAEKEMEDNLLLLGAAKPPGLHYILPIILFDDSTLCDNIGRLLAQPILCTIGNIRDELRRHVSSWFILGMVPPYPKSSKERESDRSKKLTQENYIKFYHSCLREILTEFKDLASRKAGVPIEVPNLGIVNFHFRLCLIIGDTKGHDDMCGHYNSHSSNICRMVRDCNIPQSTGDDPYFPCQFVSQSSIEKTVDATINIVDNRIVGKIEEARNKCRLISQHLLRPVYWDIPTGGDVHGIFACLPYEVLHLFYLGLMKYLLHALFNLREVPKSMSQWYSIRCSHSHPDLIVNDLSDGDIGSDDEESCVGTHDSNSEDNGSDSESSDSHHKVKPGSKKNTRPSIAFNTLKELFNKPEFEKRFRVVTNAARRQSDREMPRAPFKNGVTDQTRLTGQEYPGLCLVTLVAMKGMLSVRGKKTIESSFVKLIFMTLSLECALMMESYSTELLSRLDVIIPKYLDIYRRVIGPFRECYSRSGLRISKFHGLLHSTFYIRRYGNPYNYFGGFCESHIKSLVKKQTKNTSRRQDRLDLDLMNRQHESHVVSCSHDELQKKGWFEMGIKQLSNIDTHNTEDKDEDSSTKSCEGGFRPHRTVFVGIRKRNTTHWHILHGDNTYNQKVFPVVSGTYGDEWVRSIIHFAMDTKDVHYDQIEFFFGCDIPSDSHGKHDTLRCHPDFHSYPWQRRSWHDWIMVNWETTLGRFYDHAAKLLLWARLSDSVSRESELVCAIHSLRSANPTKDSNLPFFVGDRIDRRVRVIPASMVSSVAYVLPTVEKPTDPFPTSAEDAHYFVVIPPRSTWMHIGLDMVEEECRSYIGGP
jgi:Plavaka transposase